jgi:hypothetical protein
MNTVTPSPVNTLLARLFQEPELLQRLRTDPGRIRRGAPQRR